MRQFAIIFFGMLLFITSCGTNKVATAPTNDTKEVANDTVRIASEDSEYEIIIIEPGFNAWMVGRAKPKGYYSQQFLEGRNRIWVTEWNRRVNLPQQFNPNLYELPIDYNTGTDYGYEVNYKLYYYLVYFQQTYKQRLGSFVPRL